MKKVDISSYKGVRDFYPEDMYILDYIFSVWHEVLESYGFEHYNASILESSELYETKTSQEIVNEQTYNFIDRGNRKVTLRPEMTPSLVRMISKKQRELSFPLRWYSIPNLFRYEKPQKGRLREHWQLNVDIFGIKDINADAEIIEIAYKIMKRFKLNESDFVIKVNDRKILEETLEELNLEKEKRVDFIRLLDKKDKIKNFNDEAIKILGRPYDLVIEANENINNLIKKLSNRGIKNVVFDPNLARGFDYYTGVVFEIFDTNSENKRALFGGGRYDDLLEVFGGRKVGTVGFGMGDVTIQDVLKSRDLLPSKIVSAHLGIAILDEKYTDYAIENANNFRSQGLDTTIHYPTKKIADQVQFFNKKEIPFVVFVGENEFKNQNLKIKQLSTGKEIIGNQETLINFIKDNL